MNSENKPNVYDSGTTSTTEPTRDAKPHEPPELKNVPEADYLTQQQDKAREAMGGVVADMKKALAEGADVREWTRQHPWILAGTATVAGFVAGMLVVPPKQESFKDYFEEKWESFKDAMTPTPPATPAGVSPEAAPRAAAQPQQPSMLGGLIREVLKVVGPTIGGLITGAIAGQQQGQQADGHDGNGNASHFDQA
jgi:ElaB/YqjD/DUF883 family membrane-anchored ribosome-binding protein